MARFLQPSIALAIASGRASSRKNSAGPPMPNEVRDASASSSLTPARPRSQARLDLVRQVILAAPPPAWLGSAGPRHTTLATRPADPPWGANGGILIPPFR